MARELEELQQRFWRLITAPEGAGHALRASGEGVSADSALDTWIEPPAHGTALERLEIYANMYFYRLLDAMRSDCARLHALIGEGHFHNLVTDYLLAHPSRHPSLRHLPRHLAGFLRGHPLSERWPAASELAALEWARAGAFDAADTMVLTREQLAAVAPLHWDAMTLSFVPSLQLLDVEYAVHDLWRQLESGLAATAPERAPATLLVWRRALVVYHRPIPVEEASALRAALGGARFGAVCARVAEVVGEAQAAPTAAALVARWVSDGLLSAVTLAATGCDGAPPSR